MFPIGDERHPGATGAPLVTWALIALNALAFLVELSQPSPRALQAFVTAWGVVPREYALMRDLEPGIPLPFWTTLVTSMFLHGGWAHLGGNMLYLWIFGDNLEHRMGHARFFLFYLLTGLAAGLAHIVFSPESMVPTVGASGAISGVLGGYMLLFPHNRIRMLSRMGIVYVPAWVALGFWIVIQLVSQAGSMARTEEGGVAYLAHIGGFVAGLALVKLFAGREAAAPRRMGDFRY
jgi:membrane associated rhomboid family serine protease